MTHNISSVTAVYDANLRRHKGKNKQNKYQRSTALSGNLKIVTEDTFNFIHGGLGIKPGP